MTELEEAVFSEDIATAGTEEENLTPEGLVEDSMNETKRMKRQIEEENELLERSFNKNDSLYRNAPRRKKRVYIGLWSCAASLLLMGISLYTSLNSPLGAMNALKVAPLMLVFLGIEIIARIILNRNNSRLIISGRNILLTILLIGISSVITIISAINSTSENERSYVTERMQNIVCESIRMNTDSEKIRTISVSAELYEDNLLAYKLPTDLGIGDRLNVSIDFSDARMTIREFASLSRKTMDGMESLGYPYGDVIFCADDGINRYTLNLDWKFQSGLTAEQLSGLVNYFGDNIQDIEIPDIDDIDEEEEF